MFVFLTFYLLIAIGNPKQYPLWISLHILVLLSLLACEYIHPDWVPDTYKSKSDRYIDIGATSGTAIAFIFFITNYMRKNLDKERVKTEERELAISNQNRQIIEQNHLLEKVNAEKTKLFSIISHDLRAPLDSIRGYLELVSEHLLSEDELATMHQELLNQTKYTSELLLNLLYWSKAQMQGISVHLVSICVKDIMDEVCGNKLSNAAMKGIKITYSIKPEIEVVGDKDMLRIVLRNLINNAIKFTKPGGEIKIKVTINSPNAEISVRDNGIGIPLERRDDIFRHKTNSTYGTNNEKGIGLGLILCREFMDYQNGKIWFESEEGIGSVFYISLPMTKPSAESLNPIKRE